MKSKIESHYRPNKGNMICQGDMFSELEVISYSNGEDEIIYDRITLPYSVVLSQDCDIEQNYTSRLEINNVNNVKDENKLRSIFDKLIPSILLCVGFPAEQVRQGIHLTESEQVRQGIHLTEYNDKFNILMDNKGKENKSKWKNILKNETPRYHYLKGNTDLQIPDLVLDFKRYYTIPNTYFYNQFEKCYLASLSELFREDLSNRFAYFLSRIGLPEFNKK
ncbi:MAG: hypothetical protein LBT66_00730 [Methanobrevibacter sp.]|jgi:hypothetical protein|nr:hypothetical protein [Candidatus Methanovirga meridionalis]